MSEPFNSYYQYAQLALAAYGDLPVGVPDESILTGSQVGFSQFSAREFSRSYQVLDQIVDTVTGFSATLFQDSDGRKILAIRGTEFTVGDLATDALIGLFGATILNPQYLALKNYVERLYMPVSENGPGLGLLGQNEQFSIAGHSLSGYLGSALTADSDLGAHVSQVYTYNAPGAGGALTQLFNILGLLPQNIADVKITNLNADNGLSLIAGLGIQRGLSKDIFIEAGTALHNHSIVTLTDSLALYNLFATIDPEVNIDRLTGILNAAGTAGGSSLEVTVAALRSLFQLPTQALTLNTPLEDQDRDAYYEVINNVASQLPPGPYVVESLVGQSAEAVAALATAPPDWLSPLAYRYALTQLNPFVIHGADYDRHNTDGELDLFDDATGTGTLTAQYLTDRALFLAEKIALNREDATTSAGSIYFFDTTQTYEIATADDPMNTRQFLFGSALGELIQSGTKDDHLYGGGGDDHLIGNDGDDYLQGDRGNDELAGGVGNDTLVGGADFDTYLYTTGEGLDTILDRDGQGRILYDNAFLTGGNVYGDQRVHRDDAGHLYVDVGLGLSVAGTLLVEGYQAEDLGLSLSITPVTPPVPVMSLYGDLAPLDTDPNTPGVQWQYDSLDNIIIDPNRPEPGRADRLNGSGGNDLLAGRGGGDILAGWAGDDILYADMPLSVADAIALGNTQAGSGLKGDWLAGGTGDDTLVGSAGNDVLTGGEGRDRLYAGLGNDALVMAVSRAVGLEFVTRKSRNRVKWLYRREIVAVILCDPSAKTEH